MKEVVKTCETMGDEDGGDYEWRGREGSGLPHEINRRVAIDCHHATRRRRRPVSRAEERVGLKR